MSAVATRSHREADMTPSPKPASPTCAPGQTGQPAPTRTERKQHGCPSLGPRASSGPQAPSTTPTSRSLHAFDARSPCVPITPAAPAHQRLPAQMCGKSMEPLAHHAVLCSRAQVSWGHDVIAEPWQACAAMPASQLTSNIRQRSYRQATVGGSPTSIAEASQEN